MPTSFSHIDLCLVTLVLPLLQLLQNCYYYFYQRVSGNDNYGITGIPITVGGREVVERVGLGASTRIVYPGSGREDAQCLSPALLCI